MQLAALARQECPVPWEVLVCDNGSTDGTVRVAESWADRLPLRVVDAAALLGAGPARNEGVKVARGEWIGFCDADDEVGDDWLATLCAALERYPFVAGRLSSERLNSPRVQRSRVLEQQTGLQFSSEAVGLPHAASSNLGIHRSAFLEVGGFDPAVRYLQDTDLCWRVQLAGYVLEWVPELVVYMRLRSTLRAMYRQGWNYGASQARLERRYAGAARRAAAQRLALRRQHAPSEPAYLGGTGVVTDDRPVTADCVPADRTDPGDADSLEIIVTGSDPSHGSDDSRGRAVRGAVRLARHFVDNRSSLGAQVWQVGWHVGHRAGARD